MSTAGEGGEGSRSSVTGLLQSPEIATVSNRDRWVQPSLLALFASFIVLYRIGSFGLWSDEAFSVSTSLRPWGDLARLSLQQETNGVLYAFFLKVWAYAGTSETWFRLPSALCFVASVFLTYVLGRRIHGQAAGAIAGGLVAVHGSFLQFGQNVRFYAPVVTAGLGFMVFVHRSLSSRSRRSMLPVAVLAVVLPLLHLVAATLIVAALVIFLIDDFSNRPASESPRSLIAAPSLRRKIAALVPGLLLACVVAALVSSRDEGQSINLPLGRESIAEVLLTLTGSGGTFGLAGYGLLLATSLATLFPVWKARTAAGGRFVDVLLPWVAMVVTAVCVLAGSVVTTLMVGRYVLFLVPYLALAAAIGIVGAARLIDTSADHSIRRLGGMTLPTASPQPWGAARLVTVGTLCAAMLVGVIGAASGAVAWTLQNDRPDWRPLARTLLDRATTEDVVLFANDSTRLFVEFELKRFPARLSQAPKPLYPSGAWGSFRTGDQKYLPFSPGQVDAALRGHRRVWLVVEQPLVEEPLPELVTVLARHRPTQQTMFDNTGSLYLLEHVG